jgi:pimeloyl-ACP methyl ester carboxylesterase
LGIARGSGLRIYYELTGTGRPLVLLHDRMGSVESWRIAGYVEALAAGHQLVLVDLRGHGLSEKPMTPASYIAAQQAEDVVAVLDDLGLESAVVVGWGLGGDVALGSAASHPERIDGAVTIGSSAGDAGFADVPRRDAKAARALATRLTKEGTAFVAAELEAADRPQWARHLRRSDAKAMAALSRASTVGKRGTGRLTDLLQPILAIWGEREAPAVPLPLPGTARLVVIPAEDHIGAFSRADLVVPEIRGFLSAIPIRRTDW